RILTRWFKATGCCTCGIGCVADAPRSSVFQLRMAPALFEAMMHAAFLDRGEPVKAARSAFWLAFVLLDRPSQRAQAGGWLTATTSSTWHARRSGPMPCHGGAS